MPSTLPIRLGEDAELRCSYNGVTDVDKLFITWYKLIGDDRISIWQYDRTQNQAYEGFGDKYRAMPTSLVKSHGIVIQEMQVSDQTTYTCELLYTGNGYKEETASVKVFVLGEYKCTGIISKY